MESSYSSASAVPMEADDAMAQFLGLGPEAHGGHGSHGCFTYEQQDESMEAMAAMLFMPGLDTDSNSSSSCLNYDAPPHPQCWPQPQPGHAHSSSVTSFLDPAAHGFEGFEFPAMEMDDPFPHADFQSHCATIPFFGEEFLGNHSSGAAGGEEALHDHAPVNNKRKSSSAAIPASKKAKKAGKKGLTGNENDEGGDACIIDPQSSSSCTSEDGDVDGNAKSSSKKTGTRASRGAATDPQSLYARKRRERINERLKILQTLVPNGTKVDISTMLEEAVEYVKFMQLQIKLLSSDDTWMYAPLAYNGINVGSFDLNIAALRK